jgi:hypothetical protein
MNRLALPKNALACAAAPNMKMLAAKPKRNLEMPAFFFMLPSSRDFLPL